MIKHSVSLGSISSGTMRPEDLYDTFQECYTVKGGAMYTTIKGNQAQLTPALWAGIKRLARKRFDGSDGLFSACWKQYRAYVNGATDSPQCIDDVTGWLESIASEKVNNPRSRFYIHG